MFGSEVSGGGRVVFAVSDPAQLGSLAGRLASGPGIEVERVAGVPGAGELGAVDVLSVVAGSSGLVAAVRMLPEFLRAKRSGLTVTTTVNGQPFTLDATNVDEVLPILERLLDA